MESQNDITNLIPKGLGAYWLLFLGGSASIALLEFAYFKLPDLTEKLGITTISPLDIASRESLLNWGISVLLLTTAMVALLNFWLCRKYNDPQGQANVWFWASTVLIFLNLDAQTGVRETIRDVLTAMSGTPLYKDGTIWWLVIYVFFLGIIGTRILLEMTVYAPSLGLYLLAISGMIVGLLVEIGFIPIFENPVQNLILQTAIQSISVLLFFLAVTLFARRQVFRDPEVALRWFAKVWKQSPILKTQQPPKSQSEPKPAETKNSSSNSRPTVNKQPESVPFTKPSEKNDGFDTANIVA